MTRETVQIIRVFISSPGDVAEEREVLPEVVDSINRTDGQAGGFRLELFRWEDDVVPQIGPRPQQVVDAQTTAYDIYLGIMSTRFGTPSGRHGSGTEKEYKDALKDWKAVGVPWITFYFEDRPTLSSDPADVEQYLKVCQFRKRMQKQGLYATYKGVRGSAESFYEKVAVHLRKIAGQIPAVPKLPLHDNPKALIESNGGPIRGRAENGTANEKEENRIVRIVGSDTEPRLHRVLLRDLGRELATGNLKRSELGPLVRDILQDENGLEMASDYDPFWIVAGINASDHYFPPIRFSAGQRDWQRDFAKIATPILVGVSRSLKRSAEAQALIVRLCDRVAGRIRLHLKWPDDPDESNDLKNAIYRACVTATDVESDDVLVEVQKLTVVGPG